MSYIDLWRSSIGYSNGTLSQIGQAMKILIDHENESIKGNPKIGSIIKYWIGEAIDHWGIYIGGGYVIGKFEDHRLHLQRITEGKWRDWKIVTCGSMKLAQRAAELYDQKIITNYSMSSSNCQHWVKKLACEVGCSCPEPRSMGSMAGLNIFLNINPFYQIGRLLHGGKPIDYWN